MTALLWLALALAQADVAPVPAQAERGAAVPSVSVKGADLQLLESVRVMSRRVERMRGEAFARPPVAVRTPDHMREVAAAIRALNVLPRVRLEARGRAWDDLGLGRPGSPEAVYLVLAADLAGIGFDPEGNRLLVAPDRLSVEDFAPDPERGEERATVLMETGVRVDEPLLCHLLMHVRQRERSDGDLLGRTTDALLAGSAWSEGEANLVAVRYLFGGMGLADEVLEQSLDPADVLEGALVPPGFEELGGVEGAMVRFVYEEGFASTVETFRRGGWEALGRAMARRRTTRDVLHPDREPLVPDPCVVEAPAAAAGLALADEDSLGEQAIFILFSRLTGKDDLALQAGDGWLGDRLYRFESEGGESGVTLWVSRWASEQDAADLDYAILRSFEARLPGRPPIVLEGGERLIQTAERVFRLRRDGREVRLQISTRGLDEPPPGALAGGG